MNQTTVKTALVAISEPFAKNVVTDRAYLIGKLNAVRNSVFGLFPTLGVFKDSFGSFQVQAFPVGPVANHGYRSYLGVTLPRGFAAPVKCWQSNRPLLTRSEWRAMHTDLVPCEKELAVTYQPGLHPTERDLLVPSKLRVYADSAADAGKTVVIEVRHGTIEKKLRFDLIHDNWTECSFVADTIVSVSLPEITGSVSLAAGDRTLSRYYPGETAPGYARIMVNTKSACDVFVRAKKEFSPIYFDSDIVEIGDEMVLKWVATFVRYATNPDESKRRLAGESLQLAKTQLEGLHRQYLGRAFQDGQSQGRVNQRHVLPGYSR